MPFLIILGLFLIFKKKLLKFKLGLPIGGFFVMIVCFIILSSHWASIGLEYNGLILDGYSKTPEGISKYLIFSNSINILKQIRVDNASPFNPQLGGGYVGFILAGSINSAITPIGLNIVCWLFFIGGLVMLLNKQVKALFLLIKNKSKQRKEKSSEEYKEVELTTDEEPEIVAPAPNENKPIANLQPQPLVQDDIVIGFHTNLSNEDKSLKKARLTLQSETIMEDSMVKKIEEANAPVEEPKPTISEARFDDSSFKEETPAPAPVVQQAPSNDDINVIFDEPEQKEEVQVIPETNKPEVTSDNDFSEEPEEFDILNKPQPKANLVKNYIYPSLDLLDLHEEADDATKNEGSCANRTELINKTFEQLRVGAQVVGHTVGPSVTRYDIQTNIDVSISSVQKYINDISIRLGGVPVRFETIVPGKSTSGLEIPNEIRTNVGLRESLAAMPTEEKYLMNIPFGRGISGELIHASLAGFPHMLIAGTTGSGKSITVHSTILTLIMRNKPEQLKLILVDPKKVEMSYYDDIPHLLCPIITDMRKTYNAMKKLVDEMERRYNLFSAHRCRDIKGFNAWCKDNGVQPLPYIVMFVDEYADLVEQVKEVPALIQRLVQKARAAGIHLVIATQRPSTDVIDGTIKSNFSTRIALLCATAIDSTIVIGEGGAEKLMGHGDMLVVCPLFQGMVRPRLQGCYVDDSEVNRVCDFLREHYPTQYDPYFLDLEDHEQEKSGSNEPAVEQIDKSASEEQQYQDIKDQVMRRDTCSISFIQRSFGMGFPRAGRIFARLIKEGIVSAQSDASAKGNKVLVHAEISNEPQIGSVEQSTLIPDNSGEEGNN